MNRALVRQTSRLLCLRSPGVRSNATPSNSVVNHRAFASSRRIRSRPLVKGFVLAAAIGFPVAYHRLQFETQEDYIKWWTRLADRTATSVRAIGTVVRTLGRIYFATSNNGLTYAVHILANLAEVEEHRRSIVQSGGAELLMRAANDETVLIKIRRDAAYALGRVGADVELMEMVVQQTGVLPLLKACDLEEKRLAEALGQLACRDGVPFAVPDDTEALHLILKMMQGRDPDLARFATWLLSGATKQIVKEESTANRYESAGLVSALSRVIEDKDPIMQRLLSAIIRTLSEHNVFSELLSQEEKVLTGVLDWSLSRSSSVQVDAWDALYNLSRRASVRTKLTNSRCSQLLQTAGRAVSDDPSRRQSLCRLVAHLSEPDGDDVSALFQDAKQRKGWLQLLLQWLQAQDKNLQQDALQALSNLALSEESPEGIVAKGWVRSILISAAKSEDIEVQRDVARAVGIYLSEEGHQTSSWMDLATSWASSRSSKLQKDSVKAMAKLLATSQSACRQFVATGGLPMLRSLVRATDVKILRQVARTLANVSVHPDFAEELLSARYQWKDVLTEWMQSRDPKLASEAGRALSNLLTLERHALRQSGLPPQPLPEPLVSDNEGSSWYQRIPRVANRLIGRTKPLLPAPNSSTATDTGVGSVEDRSGVVYLDGVHLLYPDPYTQSRSDYRPTADIVFIHGLQGGPFKTWRCSNEDKVYWPANWLPADLPGVRVLSLEYDAPLLASAHTALSPDLSLAHRSEVLLSRLQAVGVGDRPIVFVTHSMGGLLAKYMLVLAQQRPEFQELCRQTRGVVFYSTPHRGSYIADLPETTGFKFIVRPTAAVSDLRRNGERLLKLNDDYRRLGHIENFSLGESLRTKVSIGIDLMVVEQESAYPGYGEFIALPQVDHINICKPATKVDPRYAFLLSFLKHLLAVSPVASSSPPADTTEPVPRSHATGEADLEPHQVGVVTTGREPQYKGGIV